MGKFTILGETKSGKTCYLLGMYSEMTMGVAGYTVAAENPEDDKNLTVRYNILLDKSRGESRFPVGTDDVQKMSFSLQYAYKHISSFEWIDYPGVFIDPARNDVNSEQYQEVEKSIHESDMLFICMDGANLVGNNTRNKIRKVKTRCAKNINPYISKLEEIPPVTIIITKYDLCMDDTDEDEIREIVSEAFQSFFLNDDNFVAIIPVSLGDTLKDDDYKGELYPINIHLPILLGIKFELINALYYGKDLIEHLEYQKRDEEDSFFLWRDNDKIRELGKDIEHVRKVAGYFKQSLQKMNRELDDVEMIFAYGTWLDEKNKNKFWTEVQKIAEYF